MSTGNYKGAMVILNKVEKIDPNYPYGPIEKLLIYRTLQDTAAMRQLMTEPEKLGVYTTLYNYELGNYEEAIEGYLEEGTAFIWPSSYLASAYYKAGKTAKSDSIVREMIAKAERARNIDFGLAVIFASRGDKAQALKWFKSAYAKHDDWIVYARVDADLKLIINEPEVQKILKTIGL